MYVESGRGEFRAVSMRAEKGRARALMRVKMVEEVAGLMKVKASVRMVVSLSRMEA